LPPNSPDGREDPATRTGVRNVRDCGKRPRIGREVVALRIHWSGAGTMETGFRQKVGGERVLLMLPASVVMMGRVRGDIDPSSVAGALAIRDYACENMALHD